MKNILILLSVVIISSCSQDCSRRLENMKLFSSTTEQTTEIASIVMGYYHSEFQSENLSFTIEFDHFGAGEYCDYSWANYPLEETINITCDRQITFDGNTIPPNESLNNIFQIEKFETESFFIAFLLKQNANLEVTFPSGNYTFAVSLETENGEIMENRCIVKYQ